MSSRKVTLFIFLYFYFFWLRWVFVAARGLSLVAASGGNSLLRCGGFSLRWLLLLRSMGSRHVAFSSCGSQAQQLWLAGSRAQAQQLWRTGLVTPWHVGSSRTRARTRVSCTDRQILNHCTIREVQKGNFRGIQLFWFHGQRLSLTGGLYMLAFYHKYSIDLNTSLLF